MKRPPVSITTVLVVLVTCACGSATPELSDPTWSGTWQGTGDGASQGTLTVKFGPRDAFGPISSFDVDVHIQGTACESPEGIWGYGRQTAAELPPSVRFAVQFGSSVYRFEGTRSGYAMGGTYARVSGPCVPCECGLGESGTWAVAS